MWDLKDIRSHIVFHWKFIQLKFLPRILHKVQLNSIHLVSLYLKRKHYLKVFTWSSLMIDISIVLLLHNLDLGQWMIDVCPFENFWLIVDYSWSYCSFVGNWVNWIIDLLVPLWLQSTWIKILLYHLNCNLQLKLELSNLLSIFNSTFTLLSKLVWWFFCLKI